MTRKWKPKFECQSKTSKQDTKLTIRCYVNKTSALFFLFILVQYTCEFFFSSWFFGWLLGIPYLSIVNIKKWKTNFNQYRDHAPLTEMASHFLYFLSYKCQVHVFLIDVIAYWYCHLLLIVFCFSGCYSNIGYYRDRNRPQEIGMYEPYCMNVSNQCIVFYCCVYRLSFLKSN